MAELPGELGSGFQDFGSLDEGFLDAELGIALDETFDGLDYQVGAHRHKLVVDVSGGVRVVDAALLAEDDASGVDVVIDHEGGHARDPLAVDDGPVDGGRAAVLWQQGGVEVERPELGHRPDFLGQHPEGDDHEEVGLPGAQGLEELGIFQLGRLQHGDAVLHRIFLDRAFVYLESASSRLVGHGHDARDLVPLGHQGLKGCNRELGRAHIHYARLLEEACDGGLDLPPAGLDLVRAESAVVRGLPDEVSADRDQHVQRNERSVGRGDGAVLGKLGARQVHDPV